MVRSAEHYFIGQECSVVLIVHKKSSNQGLLCDHTRMIQYPPINWLQQLKIQLTKNATILIHNEISPYLTITDIKSLLLVRVFEFLSVTWNFIHDKCFET